MKSKLTKQSPTAVVLAVMVALTALVAPAADDKGAVNPGTGRPPTMNPNTGLPLPEPPLWKDPNWKDPEKVLAGIFYDNLPLSDIARILRDEFKDAFDVLIPSQVQDPNDPASPFLPDSISVRMQLKNVTASEVFNAMNLMFEGENIPCRWELILNGRRPTAILRVLPRPLRTPSQPSPPQRLVYFVGDLIGDDKPGGMTMERLVKTVTEICLMSYGSSKSMIQFHKDAQLLIITGGADEVAFVQQTLSALREKVQAHQKPQPKAAEPKADGKKSE